MMIRWNRFNIYLAAVLVVVAACGCHSTGEKKKSKKILATLRLHMQANRDSTKSSESVPVFREKPVWVTITKDPFLTEAQVSSASVVDAVGGFALRIQFDHRGSILLEEYTTANRGRMIAIFCQFGDDLKDFRWVTAPVISRPITDGLLLFTPDANREESEEIATGLNNVSKKVHAWVDR